MTSPPLRRRTSRALIAVSAVAAFLYANFLIDWVLRGFTGMGEVVSELEAPGEPNAVLLRVTDVVCAVLVVSLLPWVRGGLRPGVWRGVVVWATVVFAVGAAGAAIVATPCGPSVACDDPDLQLQLSIHDLSSIVSDTALYVGVAAAWLATRAVGPAWFSRSACWNFWLGGVVSSVVYEYFTLNPDPAWAVGASQRVHIVFISAWILCLGVFAATEGVPITPKRVSASTDANL